MKMTIISTSLVLLAIATVTPAFALTAADAEKAALAGYPGGKLTAPAELEDENGVQVYGVHVTAADGKQYDVKVDAASGKVLKSDADDPGGSEGGGEGDGTEDGAAAANAVKRTSPILAATLTPEQAQSAALAIQPGTVTLVELEDENGVSVYGIHITDKSGSKVDVKVDAATGKVLKSEPDTGVETGGEGAPETGAAPAKLRTSSILSAAITPDAAQKAALATQAGTVTLVELEDENGTSVYGVHVTATDGKQYDVKVDATTGAVLKSEPDTGVEAGGGDESGGTESGGTESDGNSETNQG